MDTGGTSYPGWHVCLVCTTIRSTYVHMCTDGSPRMGMALEQLLASGQHEASTTRSATGSRPQPSKINKSAHPRPPSIHSNKVAVMDEPRRRGREFPVQMCGSLFSAGPASALYLHGCCLKLAMGRPAGTRWGQKGLRKDREGEESRHPRQEVPGTACRQGMQGEGRDENRKTMT